MGIYMMVFTLFLFGSYLVAMTSTIY